MLAAFGRWSKIWLWERKVKCTFLAFAHLVETNVYLNGKRRLCNILKRQHFSEFKWIHCHWHNSWSHACIRYKAQQFSACTHSNTLHVHTFWVWLKIWSDYNNCTAPHFQPAGRNNKSLTWLILTIRRAWCFRENNKLHVQQCCEKYW